MHRVAHTSAVPTGVESATVFDQAGFDQLGETRDAS
jgi:hypothetical protein